MSDYAVQITIKNARILRLMRQVGFANVAELARATKTDQTTLGRIVNLKETPFDAKGNWRSFVIRLATVLNCLPDDLFSEAQKESALRSNKAVMEVAEHELQALLETRGDGDTPEELYGRTEQYGRLRQEIAKLSPRMQEILSRRFGLDGNEQTYEEIAQDMGVTRERIRQIECKAIRKLKHPSRTRNLRALPYSGLFSKESALA